MTIKEIPSAYDFKAIVGVCEEIEQEAGAANADLILNVTGGTKIVALAAFQSFYFNNRRIIYLDTSNNQLLQLAPETISLPVQENLVKVHDYLVAYGMNPQVNPAAIANRRPQLQDLATLLVKNENWLSRLNAAIGRQGKKPQYVNISLNELAKELKNLEKFWKDAAWRPRLALRVSTSLHLIKFSFAKAAGWRNTFIGW